jgi:nucleoside-diphosphate-sugar epimerase
MNFLVTGGAGYIGSVLVGMILLREDKVRVFDKLYFDDKPLEELKSKYGHKLEIVQGDVREFDDALLDGIDAVIHLGALSNDPTADFDPKATVEINYKGTVNVAEACKRKGIKRFSFASTAAVYGFHVDSIADESFSTNPQSEYAKSRVDCDNALMKMADDKFFPVSFRQGTVYGASPRWRYDLAINTFTRDAFFKGILNVDAGGGAWRPFVDIKDVASAHILAVTCPENKISGGQIFNLVFNNFQIIDLAHRIKFLLRDKKHIEVEVDYSAKEARSYRMAGEKLKKILGFVPEISIEESVLHMYGLLEKGQYSDFNNPYYYNMPWMLLLVDMEKRLSRIGKIF